MNTENSLFNNPWVQNASKSMSEKDKERYKLLGEEMYNNVDFEQTTILNNMPAPMSDAVMYIAEGIKSGLHPILLEENEKELMRSVYGENWYTQYGYTKEDLEELF